MAIQIAKCVLRNFRRRALRRYPREYVETIWGRKTRGGFHIVAFQEMEHSSSTCHVDFDREELRSQVGRCDSGLICLGTIHSHPYGELKECDCGPSEFDWNRFREDGEIVSGIYGLWRRKGKLRGRVRFFFAQAILEVKSI